jgi:hypothetical protein
MKTKREIDQKLKDRVRELASKHGGNITHKATSYINNKGDLIKLKHSDSRGITNETMMMAPNPEDIPEPTISEKLKMAIDNDNNNAYGHYRKYDPNITERKSKSKKKPIKRCRCK